MQRPRLLAILFPALLAGLGTAQDDGSDDEAVLGPFDGPVLPLTLEQVLQIASTTNIGLQVQAETAEVRRYEHLSSWGAFDPVLTLSTSVSRATFQDTGFLSGGGGVDSIDRDSEQATAALVWPFVTGGTLDLSYDRQFVDTTSVLLNIPSSVEDTFAASYTQPLLRGAWRDRATTQQRESALRVEIEQERLRELRQDTLSTVANAYWDLSSAYEQLAVARIALDLGQQQLDDNIRREEVGVGTEVEVLQSRASVATQEEQLLRAQVDVVAASDALRTAILPRDPADDLTTYLAQWDGLIDPTTPLPEVPAYEGPDDWPDWSGEVVRALDRRSNLRRGRLEIDVAEVQLERARSDRLASLDLVLSTQSSGFGGSGGDAFGFTRDFDFPVYTASLSFSQPLRNRTARNAEASARAGVRIARLQYQDAELTVVSEVRTAVRDVVYNAEAVAAAQVSADLAQRQLEAEEAAFREGDSTIFQVLDFQRQLTEALSSLAAARADHAKARVALERAIGELGEGVST